MKTLLHHSLLTLTCHSALYWLRCGMGMPCRRATHAHGVCGAFAELDGTGTRELVCSRRPPPVPAPVVRYLCLCRCAVLLPVLVPVPVGPPLACAAEAAAATDLARYA